MIKRHLALILTAGLVLGGGAFAWANSDAARPTLTAAATGATPGDAPAAPADKAAARATFKACAAEAKAKARTQPGGDRAALRAAVAACATQAGIPEGARGRGNKGGHKGRGPLSHAVHGDLIVKGANGAFETVTFDRGTVTAVGGTPATITLARPDGKSVTLQLVSTTKYRGVHDAASLRSGAAAVVVSRDGKALTVAQRDGARSGAGAAGKAPKGSTSSITDGPDGPDGPDGAEVAPAA